jgi:hypothetical protein
MKELITVVNLLHFNICNTYQENVEKKSKNSFKYYIRSVFPKLFLLADLKIPSNYSADHQIENLIFLTYSFEILYDELA